MEIHDGDRAVSWWESLGLPAVHHADSQHVSSRVVLLGYPRAGKRALCQHLSTTITAEAHQGSSTRRQPQEAVSKEAIGKLLRVGEVAGEDGTEEQTGEKSLDASYATRLGVGAGIAHDINMHRYQSLTRKPVEFFCCDCAGALISALPTVESLQSSVVILVVDVSSPNTIREQLDWGFRTLESHTASVLREYLPNNNEVRLLEMKDQAQQFWSCEENQCSAFPELVEKFRSANATGAASTQGGVRAAGAAVLSPVRTIIIATKVDALEKLSSACNSADRKVMDFLDTSLKRSVELCGMSLRELIGQLLRYYALQHRSALGSVSSRVAPSDGDESICLVHPFFKGLWSYLEYLLASSGEASAARQGSPSSSLSDVTVAACNTDFFPACLIPCGLDRAEWINSFVVAEAVELPPVQETAAPESGFISSHQEMLRIRAAEQGAAEEPMVWERR